MLQNPHHQQPAPSHQQPAPSHQQPAPSHQQPVPRQQPHQHLASSQMPPKPKRGLRIFIVGIKKLQKSDIEVSGAVKLAR